MDEFRHYPTLTQEQIDKVHAWGQKNFPLNKQCIFCGITPQSKRDQWALDFRYMPLYEPALNKFSPSIGIPTIIVTCPNCGYTHTFTVEHSKII